MVGKVTEGLVESTTAGLSAQCISSIGQIIKQEIRSVVHGHYNYSQIFR